MADRILVVDDNPDNIDVLFQLLTRQGSQVLVADSGERALELTLAESPDLILLDVTMPGMDGFEVCRRLRADETTRNIPIIFITGREDNVTTGFSVGGDDYITKPYNHQEVLVRVQHQLDKLHLSRELKTLNAELEEKVQERTAQLVIVNRQLREEVNERRFMQDRLRYLAEHDFVTRLYNRNALDEHVTELIAGVQLRGEPAWYLQLDLDGFRLVNESCGCVAGDELLRESGEKLSACVDRDVLLARIGGDRFAIACDNMPRASVDSLIRLIRKQFDEYHFKWEGRDFRVNIRIAMLQIDRHVINFEQVLIMADEVMHLLKKNGQYLGEYDTQTRQELEERLAVNWPLKIVDGLKFNHFRVFVQQIVPINASEESGLKFEALVRLQDPVTSRIYNPDQFMPAAERFHLIPNIDRWMIEKVCGFLGESADVLPLLDSISINLSAQTLSSDDISDYVKNCLDKFNVPATYLGFEVTESERFSHIKGAANALNELSALGCKISIDDFGSGYASYSYLRDLPFDNLKIDGVFIRDIEDNSANQTLVKSILDISASLEKPVVAEFVERESIEKYLHDMGVSWGQGFYYHRPELLTKKLFQRASVAEHSRRRG